MKIRWISDLARETFGDDIAITDDDKGRARLHYRTPITGSSGVGVMVTIPLALIYSSHYDIVVEPEPWEVLIPAIRSSFPHLRESQYQNVAKEMWVQGIRWEKV